MILDGSEGKPSRGLGSSGGSVPHRKNPDSTAEEDFEGKLLQFFQGMPLLFSEFNNKDNLQTFFFPKMAQS